MLSGLFDISLLTALVIAFAVTQVANVVTTLYLHRTLAHRAMTMHPAVEFGCRTVNWLTIGIDRQEWVAIHRKHHVFSDEPDDPHSPIQRGVWNVLALNVKYYRAEGRRPGTRDGYAKDLTPDRWDRALFGRGLLGVSIGIATMVVLFGVVDAAIISVAHTLLYIGLSGCVNSFGHWFGRRPHDNKATNLRWLAMLTAGEGMHNEHHHAPRSPLFGSSWWDVGGKIAGLLSRLRLASLHTSSRLLRGEPPVAAGR